LEAAQQELAESRRESEVLAAKLASLLNSRRWRGVNAWRSALLYLPRLIRRTLGRGGDR
jgi:hypothetical protein